MMSGFAAIVSVHVCTVRVCTAFVHQSKTIFTSSESRQQPGARTVYLSSVLCLLSSVMSDDHSELVPLLPIPNRTVKRLCADDSVDYPCESRSSSDSL